MLLMDDICYIAQLDNSFFFTLNDVRTRTVPVELIVVTARAGAHPGVNHKYLLLPQSALHLIDTIL